MSVNHTASTLTKGLLSTVRTGMEEAVNRSLDRNIKLAVTGLSRSGKTAFITSLVHQILFAPDSQNLPFWRVLNSGRFLGARKMEQPDAHIAAFPYEKALECLSQTNPEWPEPTQGISEIRINMRYKPQGMLRKHLASSSNLTLDIIDYPGEWLLDLPLLNLDFEEWSAQIARQCRQSARADLAQPWIDLLASYDMHAPADDRILQKLASAYTDYLHACQKSGRGLSLIQPGRFVLPGDMKGAPALTFCPYVGKPLPFSLTRSRNDKTLYGVMRMRYEYYKTHVVRQFYRDHFARFDRQIVLVDCLQALNTGVDSFHDMQEAICMIMKNFQYGKSSLLGRLFNPRIDKLLFAASKADHVTPNQHHSLEQFLQRMVASAHNDIHYEGIESGCMAISALQSTDNVMAEFQGQKISCIKGRAKDSGEEIALFPGEVPIEAPQVEDWLDERFRFMEFKPPRLVDVYNQPFPHIRMDRVLEFLLGDKC